MTSQAATLAAPGVQRRVHWRGEPVEEFTGSLASIKARLPTFERGPFGANPRLDVIRRRPATRDEEPVPTGTVSKQYVLVQHTSVIDALVEAMRSMDAEPSNVTCRVAMSESGARIALRVELPERFTFHPPDGHPMTLTFECFNSVDRTVPLFAVLGWFRFVCRNGLVVGTTHARLRHQHRPSLRVEELQPTLSAGLEAAGQDCAALRKQIQTRVTADALRTWVDGPLAQAWGPLTAARVYAIATRGIDGEPTRTPRAARPHQRAILHPVEVPGAQAPCGTAYEVAQALAWIAVRRNNLAEQVAWRGQIPDLMARLG